MDKDKKVVNTEEQSRAVNPGDSPIQEESVSQDPVRTTNDSPDTGNQDELRRDRE